MHPVDIVPSRIQSGYRDQQKRYGQHGSKDAGQKRLQASQYASPAFRLSDSVRTCRTQIGHIIHPSPFVVKLFLFLRSCNRIVIYRISAANCRKSPLAGPVCGVYNEEKRKGGGAVADLKKRHIYLICMLALIGLFHACAGMRAVMNAIAAGTLWVRQRLGLLWGLVSFSAAELLCCLGILVLIAWAVWTAVSVCGHKGERLKYLWRRVSLLLAVLLTLYLLLCLFLGASYRADGFQEKSGIRGRPTDVESLYLTTARFARGLGETAELVPRDADGCFAASLEEIFTASPQIYRGAEALFPFLALEDRAPKRAFFSRLMSTFNYTGFYFPFTGEANINIDPPACLIPATIAHEMAHQRGVASEQEANFVAVVTCLLSGDPLYTYSGWLFGFAHLGNALYRYDPDRYFELAGALPEGVRADLHKNNVYWEQFETKAAKVSEKVYDTMLKSYGQELGVRSYGAVVDLLIAWAETEMPERQEAGEPDLKTLFPEYYGLDTFKGLEVYLWQEADGSYRCGVLTGTNRNKTAEELTGLTRNGATIEQMKEILSSYSLDKDMIAIIPVQVSETTYETADFAFARVRELFWGD